MKIILDESESAGYLKQDEGGGVIAGIVCFGGVVFLITALITGRIIASLFWPIWLLIVLTK